MGRACAALLREAGYASGRPDLSRLLAAAGADLRKDSLAGSGRLLVENDAYVISINRSGSETRQRFSIAHEIGHILLFEGVIDQSEDLLVSLARDHRDADIEHLCNRAASELLMPEGDFKTRLTSKPFTWSATRELAAFYGVSTYAALTRVAEVLIGVNILLLRRDHLTSGSSQIYFVEDSLPRRTHSVNFSRFPVREMKPNLLDDGRLDLSTRASSSLKIGGFGYEALIRRGIALHSGGAKVTDAPPLFSIERWIRPGGPARKVSIHVILLLQEKRAPAWEWSALTGRRPARGTLT